MKKVFTIIAVCAATLAIHTASAGTDVSRAGKTLSTEKTISQNGLFGSSATRATTCDTLVNVSLSSDTPAVFLWASPAVGYVSGNGALANQAGTTFYPITGVGEKYTAPSTGMHVTSAFAFFGLTVINAADSGKNVTAYVYDTTGTGVFGGFGPGRAVDSASVTLGSIAGDITNNAPTTFLFTHQPNLSAAGFFITVSLPQTTGDTLAVLTNTGSVPRGDGWISLQGAGWVSYDSLFGAPQGDYIVATICGNTSSCPTITVSTTHTGTSATASATGGTTPYTYAWSTTPVQSTPTATGLSAGTYTVTATDHNGCTGITSVTIAGIQSLEGSVTAFSVYPNPSHGMVTAAIKQESVSDVTITVTDLTGRVVYEMTNKSVKDLNVSLNLTNIVSGTYIINAKTSTGAGSQRIVID
jgi:Secretion system C-terminal sorting domain